MQLEALVNFASNTAAAMDWLQNSWYAVIVKASSGPRYVVGVRTRVDKEKLVSGTRVTLDMTTLTIMRALPREARISYTHFDDVFRQSINWERIEVGLKKPGVRITSGEIYIYHLLPSKWFRLRISINWSHYLGCPMPSQLPRLNPISVLEALPSLISARNQVFNASSKSKN